MSTGPIATTRLWLFEDGQSGSDDSAAFLRHAASAPPAPLPPDEDGRAPRDPARAKGNHAFEKGTGFDPLVSGHVGSPGCITSGRRWHRRIPDPWQDSFAIRRGRSSFRPFAPASGSDIMLHQSRRLGALE
jgi:hypothetical protein